MKKLINDPERYVDESLDGLVLAYPTRYRRIGARGRVIVRHQPKNAGLVGVASGGGFGHLPLFAGYVGRGLLDSCAVGDVFAGPSLDSVIEALRVADRGAGVLAVIGNYGGDKMAFSMATEALEQTGLKVETVLVTDDVASASVSEREKRRGVAGTCFVFKIAGAAAEMGWSLERTAAVARQAVDRCRTIGIALSSCTIPSRGSPTFDLGADQIEMGMGIHGEQGIWRDQSRPADALVDEMLDRILAEDVFAGSERVAVLCNSLGATPLEELLILVRRISERLAKRRFTIGRSLVGHFATSMEMAGASISLLHLDDELDTLLRAEVRCPFWPTL